MSLRLIFWVIVLVVGCLWMFRRPLVGLCLNMAFFPLNPVQWGAGLEEVRFQFIATACLAVAYLIHRSTMPRRTGQEMRPFYLLVLLLLWSSIVCTWAAHSKQTAMDLTWEFAKVVIFVWLITQIVSTEGELRVVAWTLFASFGLKAFLDRWGAGIIGIREADLSVGFLSNALILLLPSLALIALTTKDWKERLASFPIMFAVLAFIVFCDQRSALANLVACAVLIPVCAPKRFRLKAAAVIVVGAIVFTGVLATSERYWAKMATTLTPAEEASAASRFLLNEASWQMIGDHPWGVGLGNYQYVSLDYLPKGIDRGSGAKAAHNTPLVILAERGWVGFLLWAAVFGVTWLRLLKIVWVHKGSSQLPVVLARGLLIGMLSIAPGLYTHQEDRTDLLYWIVGLGVVLTAWHNRLRAHDRSLADVADRAGGESKHLSKLARTSNG